MVTTYEWPAAAPATSPRCARSARAPGPLCRGAADWCDRAEHPGRTQPGAVPVARLHLAQVWLDLGQHARALQVLDGAALAAARALPARFAVRWLVLLARCQAPAGSRARPPAVAALLAEAAALAPAERLARAGAHRAHRTGAGAGPRGGLRSIAGRGRRGPRPQAARRRTGCAAAPGAPGSGHCPRSRAPSCPRRAGPGKNHRGPAHRPRLRWLAPALALCAADASEADQARGAVWAQAGQQWLRTTATTQVAPEFADGFLHQHPVNQALLAWRLVTPGPAAVTGP
jgi:hypothetical protein